MTEADLQTAVLELAGLLGYLCYHTRPARTRTGWRTPVQGTGAAGYPDLTLCGHGRLIFAELKSARGLTSYEQLNWISQLRRAGCETHVWHPADWLSGRIEHTLRTREETA